MVKAKAKEAWVAPEWTRSQKELEAELRKVLKRGEEQGFARGKTAGRGEVQLRQVKSAAGLAELLCEYIVTAGAQQALRYLFIQALEDIERVPPAEATCEPWMHAEPWECKIHKPETKEDARL